MFLSNFRTPIEKALTFVFDDAKLRIISFGFFETFELIVL